MTRGRSPLAIFLAVCGVLIAALFVIALVDLAHDGGKPEFVRSNDLTSAMTAGAMLGLVAVAYLRIARVGGREATAERRAPAAPARARADRPAAGENVPGAARARSARRRRRRR